ncbi:hypothetical protein GCM10010121_079010 [Streptomyces brasiliensis]|uniref:Uncharacterized protein n=1 Tax=Streptomyces brasiliensis TaxID=1954 RepID=A0A917P2U0_9ACTN|nr:hypothetical protein GCM10010121_079010 [Streptomyces brasiliensis]
MLCQGSLQIVSVENLGGERAGGGGVHGANFRRDRMRIVAPYRTENECIIASVTPTGHP